MEEPDKVEFVKQRIQIISLFVLGIAFIFNFMFDIVYTQRSFLNQPIISGSIMQEPLFLFIFGLISVILYSQFLINKNKNNMLELGDLFLYLFSVTVIFSLLDMFRMAEFFTDPKSSLYMLSDFVFNLGFYNIILISIIVYLLIKRHGKK